MESPRITFLALPLATEKIIYHFGKLRLPKESTEEKGSAALHVGRLNISRRMSAFLALATLLTDML